jgi:hypothetical protein
MTRREPRSRLFRCLQVRSSLPCRERAVLVKAWSSFKNQDRRHRERVWCSSLCISPLFLRVVCSCSCYIYSLFQLWRELAGMHGRRFSFGFLICFFVMLPPLLESCCDSVTAVDLSYRVIFFSLSSFLFFFLISAPSAHFLGSSSLMRWERKHVPYSLNSLLCFNALPCYVHV